MEYTHTQTYTHAFPFLKIIFSAGNGRVKTDLHVQCWCGCKLVQSFDSTIEHYVPKFLAAILPFNPVTAFLGLYPKKQWVISIKTNGRDIHCHSTYIINSVQN